MPEFMRAFEFVPGAQVRVGQGAGFTCLRDGAVHTVTTDANGTPCIRCQFDGQLSAGWHYPTMGKTAADLLPNLYLERAVDR